jgi:hypothetical protein
MKPDIALRAAMRRKIGKKIVEQFGVVVAAGQNATSWGGGRLCFRAASSATEKGFVAPRMHPDAER